jgi:hypothetical protein
MLISNNPDLDSGVEDSVMSFRFLARKYKLLDNYELQARKGKNQLDIFMRLVSLFLRASIPINEIFDDTNLIIGSIPWHVKNRLKPIHEVCIGGKCG